MWATATFPPSTVPTLAFEQTSGAGTQVFGIWFGTDTGSLYSVDLLLGPATPGATAAISWAGPGYTTLNVGSSIIGDCTTTTAPLTAGLRSTAGRSPTLS